MILWSLRFKLCWWKFIDRTKPAISAHWVSRCELSLTHPKHVTSISVAVSLILYYHRPNREYEATRCNWIFRLSTVGFEWFVEEVRSPIRLSASKHSLYKFNIVRCSYIVGNSLIPNESNVAARRQVVRIWTTSAMQHLSTGCPITSELKMEFFSDSIISQCLAHPLLHYLSPKRA